MACTERRRRRMACTERRGVRMACTEWRRPTHGWARRQPHLGMECRQAALPAGADAVGVCAWLPCPGILSQQVRRAGLTAFCAVHGCLPWRCVACMAQGRCDCRYQLSSAQCSRVVPGQWGQSARTHPRPLQRQPELAKRRPSRGSHVGAVPRAPSHRCPQKPAREPRLVNQDLNCYQKTRII